MRILLVGKGGREHALAWKMSQSELLSALYLWPGNIAMQGLGESLDLPATADFTEMVAVAKQLRIDLVVSGPEAPLSQGLADAFAAAGIPTFGPRQAAAQLEASKAFAKNIMTKAGIPTAAHVLVKGESECREEALAILQATGGVVLKASGLAAGKGVFVCSTAAEVENGIQRLFHSDMSVASDTVVLEEVLLGRECSYFSFIGSHGPLGLGFAVDYKRLEDGDIGPNTGGMGCYAPVPWLPKGAEALVNERVIAPLLQALKAEGIYYCGCLYVGLMWSETKGPQVVEFNVRLGDPEAQVLALYDDRDWLALMAASCGLNVPEAALAAARRHPSSDRYSVAVVMAASSYPYGSDAGQAAVLPSQLFGNDVQANIMTFGANVTRGGRDGFATGSGRVLAVSARGASFAAARVAAYNRVHEIAGLWRSARWRSDIGSRVVKETKELEG